MPVSLLRAVTLFAATAAVPALLFAAAAAAALPPPLACPQAPSASACNAMPDSACMWNVAVEECTPACSWAGYAYRPASCLENPSCSWAWETCFTNCELRDTQSSCTNSATCAWSAGGRCFSNCSNTGALSQCRFFPSCKVQGESCVPSCRTILGLQACAEHRECFFNVSDKVCREIPATPMPTPPPPPAPPGDFCRTLGGELSCNAADSARHCLWNPFLSLCTGNCNLPYADAAVCEANPTCMWLGGSCGPRCDIFKTNQECTELHPNALCNWDGTKCFFDCTNAQPACIEYAYCRNPGNDNHCSRSCRSHPNEPMCRADPICLWNESSLSCFEMATPSPPYVPPPPPQPPAPPVICGGECGDGAPRCVAECPYCLHYPNHGMNCYPPDEAEARLAKNADGSLVVHHVTPH